VPQHSDAMRHVLRRLLQKIFVLRRIRSNHLVRGDSDTHVFLMVLGAQRSDMLQMILRQSFSIVAIGLAIGLLAALALTRLMASLLYGVSAHDFSIYALVLFVLSAAALIASYLPARRAMNVDPMVALRYE